jgi:hypothetical protein
MAREQVDGGPVADDDPPANRPGVEVGPPVSVPIGSPRGLHALDYLLEHRRAEFDRVVDHVAAMETGERPEDLSSFERRLIAVSLRRVHLPALDRRGLVVWDPEREVAALPAAAGRGAPARRPPPWHVVYLGLALAQVVVVVLAALDVWRFAAVDPLVAVTAAMSVVFLTAALHLVTQVRR